jgi:hypothetical protein
MIFTASAIARTNLSMTGPRVRIEERRATKVAAAKGI